MNIANVDGMYKASRITGPKHNYLGMVLSTTEPVSVKVLARSLMAGETRQVDEAKLLASVSESIAQAQCELDCHLFVEYIEYVISDTPEYIAYAELACAIFSMAAEDLT